MLKNSLIALLLLTSFISYSQSSDDNTNYWIDIDGKSVSKTQFLKQFGGRYSEFAVWNYITKDSGRVTKTHYKFNLYTVDHSFFLNYINRTTNKKLPINTTLLIEFHYKDDLCSSNSSNKWSGSKVANRKYHTNTWKKYIESKNENLVYLVFFEKGIEVQNSKSKREYYFSDQENILRKKIFLNPTSCGSYMLSKPYGITLVRNGESTAITMVANLDPKKWDKQEFE